MDASLLTFSVDGFTVSAHRLVMRVARERRGRESTLIDLGSIICSLLSSAAQWLGQPWKNRLGGPGHHPASGRIE